MKKMFSLLVIGLTLSGCSLFTLHKTDVEQGNVLEANEVQQLRTGMSQAQVKEILGTPMLTNIFTPNRIDYVYTSQKGGKTIAEKKVVCVFSNGRLVEVIKTNI